MDLEKKTLSLDVKDLTERGTFDGLLSVYDVIDDYGDVVERGSFTKTLQENGNQVPLLWAHDASLPIGKLSLTDGQDGLEAKGSLILDDNVPQAKTAYALLRAGVVRGLSIGFKTIKKKSEDNVRRLKEIKLYEGSLVVLPANRFALISDVKSLGAAEIKDFQSELDAIQLMDSHYQMRMALNWALSKALHDKKLKTDEKVDACAEIISQFNVAFLAFVPKYVAAMEEMNNSMGYMSSEALERLSAAPDPIATNLKEFCTKFLDLAGKHPGTQVAAGAAPRPETKSAEPEEIHSLLTAYLNELRASA